MKKTFANAILAITKGIGSNGLKLARRVLPQSIKSSLSRFVSKNSTADLTIITAKDGHQFISITDTVFLHLRMEGYYEKAISDITRSLIKPGDKIIDVGANFGWYTMLAAKLVGASGQVSSFEPNTSMFSILQKNIEINGYGDRVNAQNVGLGAVETIERLLAKPGEMGLGYVPSKNETVTVDNNSIQQIEIKVANELFAKDIGNIAFIKIDVEGFEPFVFLGANKLIDCDNPPVIQLEFNSEALVRHDSSLVEQFISNLNRLPAKFYAAQTGKLILTERVELGKNADFFIVPTKGRFANRADTLLAT